MKNYQAPENHLKDRVILVTGASDGIGKAIAIAYAKAGATVILHGRDIERLEKLYDEIVGQGYPQPAMLPFDLNTTDEQEYRNLASVIANDLGRLDGIVHNAGVLEELTPIEHTSIKSWNKIMQVNLNSVFALTKACLPLLKEAPSASIITTSSGVGRQGRAFWGAYSTSKFAIEGFTQVLADELEGTNIRANCVNPGATLTKMRAIAFPAEDKSLLKTPEDIVPVYLYLMGDDSAEINGQSISAQG
ncbi:MAG: YciK family oxidoreductase [Gammaproteobacteria bacterium]|nr:YciK family oxidoreductase [Gammaproteobacteria bacterium]